MVGTECLGVTARYMWIWSAHNVPSTTSTTFYSHKHRRIVPNSVRSLPYTIWGCFSSVPGRYSTYIPRLCAIGFGFPPPAPIGRIHHGNNLRLSIVKKLLSKILGIHSMSFRQRRKNLLTTLPGSRRDDQEKSTDI